MRKIVRIDEEKCNGCGECATACAEGAIEIIGGKARLASEDYCDGLGACLGECPQGAITIEEREAPPFDEAAARKHLHAPEAEKPILSGCPGSAARELRPRTAAPAGASQSSTPSELTHWPVQLKLVAPNAPYFKEAHLLLAADCVPFAMADFHPRFLRGKTVVVGCPKLDNSSFYVEKLAEIIKHSSLKSLTVVHMEVPCCFGLSHIAEEAMSAAGRKVPLRDVTIGIQGEVKSER
jgi:ferredoxin